MRRTRGFEEGTRAPARAFARALEACVFRSASRRRRGACSSLLSQGRSPHVRPPRHRPGDRRRRKARHALQRIPRRQRRGTGERTRAGFDSSRTCAHASFVLQKSVSRRLAQRSAHRRVRGAKPLVRVSDPRERGPSESQGARAKARGACGERRASEWSERGDPHHVSATRSTKVDVSTASKGAASERGPSPDGVGRNPYRGKASRVVEAERTSR